MPQQGRAVADKQVGTEREVQGDAAADRHHAHQEFWREAVPHPQAVFGKIRPENRLYGRLEKRRNRERRRDADHQACEHEKLGRKTHEKRRLLRRSRKRCWGRPEEHIADEAERVGDRKRARDGYDVRQCTIY